MLLRQAFWISECCSVLHCFFIENYKENAKHQGIFESCFGPDFWIPECCSVLRCFFIQNCMENAKN